MIGVYEGQVYFDPGDDMLLLDREQREARNHVRLIEGMGHKHDVNACPATTRAVCPHKATIEAMRPEDFA